MDRREAISGLEKLLREELTLMKNSDINFIRMYYPQSSDLLSLYDEYGFMMIEEVPLNWWGVKWFGETTQSLDILLAEHFFDQKFLR